MPADNSNAQTTPSNGVPVKLYVYDLSMGMARQFSQAFVGRQFEGIWHTGIVVYGNEYFFGGGLQCMPAVCFV